MMEVISLPFMTIVVKGIAYLMTHSRCMNVGVGLVTGYFLHFPLPDLIGIEIWERQN